MDGNTDCAYLRGGNGNGGPYDWADMSLLYGPASLPAQLQAVGALTHDAGASVNMQYTPEASGSDTLQAATALISTFGYSNTKKGYNAEANIPCPNRETMVNPNLDARYPVLFGISGPDGGHAIVCDGYGYDTQTLYHHLNMGWSGFDDAWYNLPIIFTDVANFYSIYKCVYNVYTNGTGEIISGRVMDNSGSPVSGATVTATGGYSATTDTKGIYALVNLPSATSFTISVAKTGLLFTPQTVSTGTSLDNTITSGNLWGVDFVNASATFNQALDNYSLNFSTSGAANWFTETNTYYYGGSAAQSGAIGNGQSTSLQTVVAGPGTLTFYWKVSSYPLYNKLSLYLDTASIGNISGGGDWTQKTLSIPAGLHTITWEYSKTTAQTSPLVSDNAWLDKVVYTTADGRSIGAINQLLLGD